MEFWADNLDVLLVAFSLAFAVRALFLQPFKIPTSSMQPTLHGVNLYHYNDAEDENSEAGYIHKNYQRPMSKDKGNLRGFLDSLYYGQQYGNIKALNDGDIGRNSDGVIVNSLPMRDMVTKLIGFPLLESYSQIYVGKTPYTLPIPKHKMDSVSQDSQKNFLEYNYAAGDKIFHGVNEDGDHLFVNRVVYNFRNPARGDISVFMTHNILDKDNSLRGQFYIKRLIGLPNETLRIKNDGKTYLVEDGKEIPLSKEHHKCFEKIFSGTNGYHGHSRYGSLQTATYDGDSIRIFERGNLANIFLKKGDIYECQIYDTRSRLKPYWHLHKAKVVKKQIILYSDQEEIYFSKLGNSYVLSDIIRKDGYEARFTSEYDEYKLGDNQYFMLGDNSNHSLDSRYWGPVPRKNLIGTAFSVFWPFSHRWGMADNNDLKDVQTTVPGKY